MRAIKGSFAKMQSRVNRQGRVNIGDEFYFASLLFPLETVFHFSVNPSSSSYVDRSSASYDLCVASSRYAPMEFFSKKKKDFLATLRLSSGAKPPLLFPSPVGPMRDLD